MLDRLVRRRAYGGTVVVEPFSSKQENPMVSCVRVPCHVQVEYCESLQRIENAKQILKCYSTVANSKNSGDPSEAKYAGESCHDAKLRHS